MGAADYAFVLWSKFLRYDPRDPAWPDRDRFVLSAGHGSMLPYSLLHLTGYPDMTLDELKRFPQPGSRTPGPPGYGPAPGLEATTRPPGPGLVNSGGLAGAHQGGHRCRSRRAAGSRRDRGRAKAPRLALSALRGARGDPRALACGRRARRGDIARLARASRPGAG